MKLTLINTLEYLIDILKSLTYREAVMAILNRGKNWLPNKCHPNPSTDIFFLKYKIY